jgi:UDP-N-acetyl-D-mannosaminuronic acid dehydrogenase
MNKDIYSNKKDKGMKQVCVVGLGYIGLPTAIMLADHGFDVLGFDVDIQKVQKINQGDPVIQEPEVYERLNAVLGAKQFQAIISIAPADCFIIAVPTPLREKNKADVSCVFDAVHQIALVIKKGNVVIVESTVPVGTTKQVAIELEQKTGFKVGTDIFVVYCPERVLPGKIFQELVENSRIIGGVDRESVEKAKLIYTEFVKGNLYLTDSTTAEMVKLVENSARDVEIAFAHQVAAMADAAGLNPYEIIALANKHPRVNILQPSAGVGGHCIAIDPWFLVEGFKEQTSLLQAARLVNNARPKTIAKNIGQYIEYWNKLHNKRCKVLLLGASYKPNVDDMRESPALMVACELIDNLLADVIVCDPHVDKKVLSSHIGDRVVSLAEGIEQADIIACLVAHYQFRSIDLKAVGQKIIIDFCGILYKNISETKKREHLFWPARSVLDIFISNQEPSREHNI